MWGLFSRDPAKDFNYDIGEKSKGLEDKSVWSMHHGKKKGTGEPVSVFVFDVKGNSESQIQLAKSSFKRIKTLRHPNILTFLDGVETDKVIYIATEPVTPLEVYLQNNDSSERHNQLAISWGFHKVAKGLSFLVNDGGLIHNNVCMSSVFVDQAGEWKLGGVDYMYPTTGQDSVPPIKILPYLERYDPPEKTELRKGIKGEKWSSDMWGLGCLIWEVFNGSLPRTSALKTFGKIPKSLVPNYCELVGANPSSRPNPAKFIEDCCRKGGFLNNPFIKTMLFLEEIQIKEPAERQKFFSNLTNALDTFPEQLCKHKVLPQLLNVFEFGNAGSMILAPLFKVGKLLDQEEYQKKIVPCVVKLFSSTDRTTRVKLLQQIELFVEHLQPSIVNEKIFPVILPGFLDTNPVVRESTIKAMIHLASKLNYKNLNEELLKHFARLQAKDDQGGIRTNTTICLGKIATFLNPQTRQKILCSAFLRAIKDPFPPARQAGIIGMCVTQNLFTLQDTCHKLLPAICAMAMDPEKTVRDQAFKAIKGFLQKLEKVSENPELQQDLEKDVMSGGVPATGAAGWAGWAVGGVSSFTSKIYSKATRKPQAGPGLSGNSMAQSAGGEAIKSTAPVSQTPEDEGEEEEEEGQQEESGWDDDEDWGDIDTPATTSSYHGNSKADTSPARETEPAGDFGSGWDEDDDDDWGSLEVSSPTTNKSNSTQFGATKASDESGWGREDTSTKQPKGALKLGGTKKAPPMEDFGWVEEEFAPVEDSSVQPASSYNWGFDSADTGDNFFSMAGSDKKSNTKSQKSSAVSRPSPGRTSARESPARSTATPGSQMSQTPQDPGGGGTASDGWGNADGWDNDSWDSPIKSGESEADRKKREREEKRLQRQQEMQQKREAKKGAGAMKLGARKFAAD